jgi:putative ABC transport system permease protein
MKTIIRNFLGVIRRYRLAAALNVLGLSVAFAAFMVIMMQVDYDRNFDRFHRDADRIFRMESSGVFGSEWSNAVSRPWADAIIQSSPHILAGTIIRGRAQELYFSVETDGEKHFYEERYARVTPSFADVFTLDMTEGSDRALADPEKALIPQSLARKLFGREPAVGRTLTGREATYTVGGVYRDFPRNSSVKNTVLIPIDGKENIDKWDDWHYECFIRLDAAEQTAGLFDNLKRTFTAPAALGSDFAWKDDGLKFRFNRLPDLHFTTGVVFDLVPKSSAQTLFILLSIAIAIVVIAGINYTNFATALVPKRVRSINIQKVFGGNTRVIRAALVFEGVIIALAAFLLALAAVYEAKDTPLAALVDADLSLTQHPGLLALTAVLAVLTGVAAGLYPSWRVTSFTPAMMLKGHFGLSSGGRRMRSVLTGIQFVSSFALIIGASFMYLQNAYMQHASTGYNRDALIVTNLTPELSRQYGLLTGRLKNFADIEDVTYSLRLLSSSDSYSIWERDYHDRPVTFELFPVDASFLRVMGIEVTDGRDFREEDGRTGDGVFIFNETARSAYELVLNDKVNGSEIIGIMPDVKFASFRKAVAPMAFFVTPSDWTRPQYAYVRVKAGSSLREALTHVQQTLKEFDANYSFEVRFFDDVLQKTYESELRLGLLIALFSLIAIFISLAGVFGLVVFDSEYRRREIGIRKVFGATTREILLTFNRTYVRILCFCFALSAPVAWYAVARWLERFAYRTPMYWWVYVAAFAAVFVLTVSTVTFQNWRAAGMNPVDSVKSE